MEIQEENSRKSSVGFVLLRYHHFHNDYVQYKKN